MKEKKSRLVFIIFYFLIVAVLIGYLVFNDYGVLKYLDLKGEISELRYDIENTEKRISALESEIDSLETNLDKIEEVGRERHNMLRKNERGFYIREE